MSARNKKHGQENAKNIGGKMSLVVSNNSGLPNEHEMMVYHTMAEQAVTSKMYKGVGDKAGVMMIMLAARELGIPPFQALNRGLNIINGTVEISARMLGALIRRAGHQFIPKKCNDKECVMWGKRADNGQELEVTFTVADAQKAGLVKPGGGWTKWPADMCFARALSRLARQLFSDVIGIGYVEGEICPSDHKPDVTSNQNVNSPHIEDPIEVVVTEMHQYELDTLLKQYDSPDRERMLQYLKVVMAHFSWTMEETIQKFMEDPALNDKFEKWKSKQKDDQDEHEN